MKTSPLSYMPNRSQTQLTFHKLSEKDLSLIVKSLKSKSSHGSDLISSRVLKVILPQILKPLMHIINLSLESGMVPHFYKLVKVLPIYKADRHNVFSNYHPISLLSVFSKILEKAACSQILSYFVVNKLLYQHQYGFRLGHSTEHALLQFTENIFSALNQNQYNISVFIDLKKAFDTVSHSIPLQKSDYYGIRCSTLDWVRSYLADRQ